MYPNLVIMLAAETPWAAKLWADFRCILNDLYSVEAYNEDRII